MVPSWANPWMSVIGGAATYLLYYAILLTNLARRPSSQAGNIVQPPSS